ncbi:hypothetical protein [Abyssisolibacter fermentans]|uniref:hypothetical protein n=1 Tax=Abyssisolibacter fermentans TaxID=1766203 RepID=UPI000832DBF0|nr:hypothetical protein [Abyssisolibacter fermentans]
MNYVVKKNIYNFVKNYYVSLNIRRHLIMGLLMIIFLTHGKEDLIINILIIITINFLHFLFFSDHLRTETKNSINNFYDKKLISDNDVVIICNLKKFNGPNFGTLYANNKAIEFIPFRDNLQDERFIIDEANIQNVQIILIEIKSSVFNRIFFNDLCKGVCLSCNGKKILLQTSEPEEAIVKIKEKIYV